MSIELRAVAAAPGRWQLVADKLQRAPDLLQTARDNIVRDFAGLREVSD